MAVNATNGAPVIPPYHAFTNYTPAIPALYLNVYSPEEVIKKMLFELNKMDAYLDVLAEAINQIEEPDIPIASANKLGGVKVGDNLNITSDGTLNAEATPYTLPIATTESLGGIKVGENLSVTSDGTLNAEAMPYTLPIATTESLGGIKVGENLSVTSDGTLNAEDQSYTLPKASSSELGGVKVGDRLNISNNGTLSAEDQSYTLPIASATVLGGIKVGNNLNIAEDGTLNATSTAADIPVASANKLGGVKVAATNTSHLIVDEEGNLSAPIASYSRLGVVTIDSSTTDLTYNTTYGTLGFRENIASRTNAGFGLTNPKNSITQYITDAYQPGMTVYMGNDVQSYLAEESAPITLDQAKAAGLIVDSQTLSNFAHGLYKAPGVTYRVLVVVVSTDSKNAGTYFCIWQFMAIHNSVQPLFESWLGNAPGINSVGNYLWTVPGAIPLVQNNSRTNAYPYTNH